MAADTQHTHILEIEALIMSFGGLTALMNVNFVVPRGIIKAIIGPNGAGKTTLFNIITGSFGPTEGRIVYDGQSIAGLKAHQIATLGISRTFQTVELFDNMTVMENVMTGFHARIHTSFLACGLGLPLIGRQEKRLKGEALDILEFIGLASKWDTPADSLPLGERKILEIGRALATWTNRPPDSMKPRPKPRPASFKPSRGAASPSCWWSTICV